MIRLSEKKTWSREVASVRERIGGASKAGFLTYQKRAMLVLALKTAIAAGISYSIAHLTGLKDGYWGAISAIIVMQSNVGSTITASRDRLIGTLIGAAFGAVFSLFGESVWIYLLTVVIAMVSCSLLGLKNSSRLAAVTVTIIMLVHRTGSGFWSNWVLPMHRVIEVLIGILVALIVATLLFPSQARTRLREGLAQEFLLLGALFDAIMQKFRGTAVPAPPDLWKEVNASEDANAQLLDAARNEPTSSSASLEALSLLHQYAQEITDLLHALEFAASKSEVDGAQESYVLHLQLELTNLARDLGLSFEYIARCIHQWKFNEEPKGFSVEADIAKLDEKIAQMRPRALEFSQQEVFRTYAVQLHLKQLARLLHSAATETAKAT